MVSGRKLELLCRVVLAAATSGTLQDGTEAGLCTKPDGSGAFLLHALLISNTSPSIALALAILQRRPSLMLQAHDVGPFRGEHGLHILAVNRRERELCTLIRLAQASLTTPEFEQLLSTHAAGPFFDAPPMKYYGGSLLGYLSAFGLKGPVALFLTRC